MGQRSVTNEVRNKYQKLALQAWHWSFLQWCCWSKRSYRMWCRVVRWRVPSVSMNHNALCLQQPSSLGRNAWFLELKELWSRKRLQTTHSTHCHIPQDPKYSLIDPLSHPTRPKILTHRPTVTSHKTQNTHSSTHRHIPQDPNSHHIT